MKRNVVALIMAVCLLISLAACGQTETAAPEATESVVVEEVTEVIPTATETESETEEAIEAESEEVTEETEESVTISPEEAAGISHTYDWGIMEFEGENSMVIHIVTQGVPAVVDSSLGIDVTESIFDYKPFTEITDKNGLLLNKDTAPSYTPDGVGDGIFGFVDDGFTLAMTEGDADENGEYTLTFSYDGDDGTRHDYSIIWKADGTVEVSDGTLTEE